MFRGVALLAAVLGMSSLSFGSGPHTDSSDATVTVVMRFEEAFPPVTMHVMKTELQHILHRSGVRLDWRVYPEMLGKELSNSFAVVHFKGKCEVDDSVPVASAILAQTDTLDGNIIPYAEVHCDRIQEMLHGTLTDEGFPQREALLGRALARVLAHELYHILTRTKEHGQNGIAKPSLRPRDLVDAILEFDKSELDEIRESVASWAGLKPPRRE